MWAFWESNRAVLMTGLSVPFLQKKSVVHAENAIASAWPGPQGLGLARGSGVGRSSKWHKRLDGQGRLWSQGWLGESRVKERWHDLKI